MSKHRKITELTIVNSLKNLSPKQQQVFVGFMRYIALPMVLIAWLHFFEMHTYAWDPFDIMNFGMLISTSITLYYLLLFVYHTAPMWQLKGLKWGLGALSLFILLGFTYELLHRKRPFYNFDEIDVIYESISEGNITNIDGLDLLGFKKDKFIIFGKKSKRVQPFRIHNIKNKMFTYSQQDSVYEKHILPIDFRKYWNLLDESGNTTSENLISNYYGWFYPNYKPYIYIYIIYNVKMETIPLIQMNLL